MGTLNGLFEVSSLVFSVIGMVLQVKDINSMYGSSSYLGKSDTRNRKVLSDVVGFCNDHEGYEKLMKVTFKDRLNIISSVMEVLYNELEHL